MSSTKATLLAVFVIAVLVVGIFSAMGALATWVLGYVGVHLPWYVCGAGLFLLGTIFRTGVSK